MAAESSDRSGGNDLSMDDRPSREEVARRINSLYDAAETATGNYNATRAMAAGGRSRPRPANAARPANPPLDAVARQWFDAARAQLGPSVPAALPASRTPARTAASRSGIPAPRRSDDGGRDRAVGSRPVAELTAGPVGAAATGAVPELTAGAAVAALPPAAEASPTATTRMPQTMQPTQMTQTAQVPRTPQAQQEPTLLASSAPSAPPQAPAPVAVPQQTWTEFAPERELLSQYAAQPWATTAPNSPSAEPTWAAAPDPAWQPAPDYGTQSMPAFGTQSMPAVGTQQQHAFDAQPAPELAARFAPDYGTQQVAEFGTQSMPVLGGTQPAPDFGASFAPETGFQPAPDFGTQSMPDYVGQVFPEPTWQPAQQLDWQPAPYLPQPYQPTAYEAELAYLADPLTSPSIPASMTMAALSTTPAPPLPPEPPTPAFTPTATAPAESAPVVSAASKTATALEFARAQLGKPCLWGASGPDTYDCAALVQAAWRAAGVQLPRTAQEQAFVGTSVPLTDVRPGDLIFFHGDAGHVGLYTGDSRMIHAPGPGTPIREESVFYAGPSAIQGAVRPA